MKPVHATLYRALNKYVAAACEGRDESHGLYHMRLVTNNAVAIYLMSVAEAAAISVSKQLITLSRASANNKEEINVPYYIRTIVNNIMAVGFGPESAEVKALDDDEADNYFTAASIANNAVAFCDVFLDGPVPRRDMHDVSANAIYDALSPDDHDTLLAASLASFNNAPFTKLAALWANLVVFYFSAKRIETVDSLLTKADEEGGLSMVPLLAYFQTRDEVIVRSGNPLGLFKEGADCPPTTAVGGVKITTLAAFETMLARVMVIAMLHDVNDHKYERPDGSLSAGLKTFVDATLCGGDTTDGAVLATLFPNFSSSESVALEGDLPSETIEERAAAVMSTISAISFSKEKKGGKRYYTASLLPLWTAVRDWVSDADKLEAIGEGGLFRCWHYSFEVRESKMEIEPQSAAVNDDDAAVLRKQLMKELLADAEKKEALRQFLFTDVDIHVDEKLAILKDQYVYTNAGKRLAIKEHDAMLALLAQWKAQGPPQL